MFDFYAWRDISQAVRGGLVAAVLLGCLPATNTQAQAPAWTLATTATNVSVNCPYDVLATALDASGNVFVTGRFSGTIAFGSTPLTSAGHDDLFLAKFVPATRTWAWAVRLGGTWADEGAALVVQGSTIYVAGSLTNNTANANAITWGGTGLATAPWGQLGATATGRTEDLLLAKFTDNGPSATLNWTQVGGGTGTDHGAGLAVSGSSLYLTGYVVNNAANDNGTLFGATGAVPGTTTVLGAGSGAASEDIVLAKYTDLGASSTLAWTQVAGGTGYDAGCDVAVRGSSVYLTGILTNSSTNAQAVVLGGNGTLPGTVPQYGTSAQGSRDLLLAKYLDLGSTAAVAWAQVAGGSGSDAGYGLVLSGSSLYVAGTFANTLTNQTGMVLGGSGTTPGTMGLLGAASTYSNDILLAKYTDLGTSAAFGWAQIAGGSGTDEAHDVAVSGNSLFITGWLTNNAANAYGVVLGGNGSTPGTVSQPGLAPTPGPDIVAAQYTDLGSSATLLWEQIGGGKSIDNGWGLAVGSTGLFVGGSIVSPVAFGTLAITADVDNYRGVLAGFTTGSFLAATPASTGATPRLYPNPASGPATLTGATAHTPVGIFDTLGRRVATATADASGTAPLPTGLAPGLYLVRAGAGTVRWVVE